MIETHRNPKDGTITAWAKGFTAVITEDGVRILVGDVAVREWTPGPKHDDEPSPRAAVLNPKRGSR
jgi:hypothetical protein